MYAIRSYYERGERGLLLHRQVRVAFVEEQVLEDVVGRRQRGFDVAELVGLVAVNRNNFV